MFWYFYRDQHVHITLGENYPDNTIMLVAYMCPRGQKEGENNLGRSLQKRFMCAPLNFPVLTKNFLILSKSLAIYWY